VVYLKKYEKFFDFEGVFDYYACDLISRYKLVKPIHNSGNIDESGDIIEVYFRNWLSKVMPHKYSVKQGHLINSLYKVSPQLDVIISDSTILPYLFKEDDFIYQIGELAKIIGEIKSKLYLNKFDRILAPFEIINSFFFNSDRTKSISNNHSLFTFVFAIDSDKELNLFINKFDTEKQKYWPDMICVLKKGVIIKEENKNGSFNLRLIDKKNAKLYLLYFYLLIINFLIHHNTSQIEPYYFNNFLNKYFKKEGLGNDVIK
jgi:hypothetical protein